MMQLLLGPHAACSSPPTSLADAAGNEDRLTGGWATHGGRHCAGGVGRLPAPWRGDDADRAHRSPPSGLVRLDPQGGSLGRRQTATGDRGRADLSAQGVLEMFACPKGTKEHESIVSVNAKAYLVHTGLLAIGARSGRPVQYDPVYQAATGDTIQVEVLWRDESGGGPPPRSGHDSSGQDAAADGATNGSLPAVDSGRTNARASDFIRPKEAN